MDRVLVVRPEGVFTREVHREREGEITLGADLPELLKSFHPRDRPQGPSRRQEVGLSRGAARVAQTEGDGVLDGRCHPTTLRAQVLRCREATIDVQDGEACPWTYALRLSTTKS
jgi:hypothetical protein